MRLITLAAAVLVAAASTASAFCGFYVATSDEPLVNTASRVVLVHRAGHTVVTMASDVHGDPKQFALVIPVPTVIQRAQVRIVKPDIVAHLADYTKPRLVQYFDADPCELARYRRFAAGAMGLAAPAPAMNIVEGSASRVRIEAAFNVDEYDIMVLSADDSDGLITWLNQHGYHLPAQAAPVIGSYIAQHMHFFVAKVDLARMKNNPTGFLRPIRVDYDTPKFMLPIRLGTVNAAGPQDMIVLALTETGRVETTNYRTIKMPTGVNIPEYVADKFGAFYDATFDRQVAKADGAAVFQEYAWPIAANAGLCDPCSSPPLRAEELAELGADTGATLFVTRLHVRYDRAHFPDDLQFQETPDTERYQARYVIQVAMKREDLATCAAGRSYLRSLKPRWRAEGATLADLTGWNLPDIRAAMVAHWMRTREQ
jgi:hypothetical protein